MKPSALKPDGTIEGEAHVALFDILGFKALVGTQAVKQLRQTFADGNLLTRMGELATLLGGCQHYVSRFKPAPCEFTQFSDTVLIISPDKGERGLVSILMASCSLIALGIIEGIPMRGGVTRGEVFVSANRRFHAGPAIVRAHDLEKQQDWVGGIVDEVCVPDGTPRHMTTETTLELMTVPYSPPLKDGSSAVLHCLNWGPFYAMSPPRSLEDAMTMHIGVGGPPESRKRANTREFYDWSVKKWVEKHGSLSPWQDAAQAR